MQVPRLAEEAVGGEDAVEFCALLVGEAGGERNAELHYAHVINPEGALAAAERWRGGERRVSGVYVVGWGRGRAEREGGMGEGNGRRETRRV